MKAASGQQTSATSTCEADQDCLRRLLPDIARILIIVAHFLDSRVLSSHSLSKDIY